MRLPCELKWSSLGRREQVSVELLSILPKGIILEGLLTGKDYIFERISMVRAYFVVWGWNHHENKWLKQSYACENVDLFKVSTTKDKEELVMKLMLQQL